MKKCKGASFYGIAFALTGILERLSAPGDQNGQTKFCPDCGETKSVDAFTPRQNPLHGHETRCRECKAARDKKRRHLKADHPIRSFVYGRDKVVRVHEDHVELQLTGDIFTKIDAADLDLSMTKSWRPQHAKGGRAIYAVATSTRSRKSFKFRLHRLIMNAQPGEIIDHINGDGLDNRRSNLRRCTLSQNSINCARRGGLASRFRGVHHLPPASWQARIQANRLVINLGTYSSEEDAARAYNRAAIERHGEFARLNDVPETTRASSTPCAEAHLEPVPSCPDPNLACNRGIVKGMEARADAE